MPNGKGTLECCYCIHYKGQWSGYDAAHEPGLCTYHNTALPGTTETHQNRICCNFSPNENYNKDNPEFQSEGGLKRITSEERFSWFDRKLRRGILYCFSYNDPQSITEMVKLTD
jgi:hypothetical protein